MKTLTISILPDNTEFFEYFIPGCSLPLTYVIGPNPGNGGSDIQTDTSGDNGSDHPASDSADKSSKSLASATDNSLPDTATSMYNYAAMGLALLLAGIVAMKVQQVRRKRENI